jgi:hypothetical protein
VSVSQTTVWELGLGDTVFARIRETGYEFPWTYGELLEAEAFERYRAYFEPEDTWPETAAFEALLDAVIAVGGFWLRDTTTGEKIERVTLNHDGGIGVWFRTHRGWGGPCSC